MAIACLACGHLVPETSRFCPVCGTLIQPDQPSQPAIMSGPTIALTNRCAQPVGLLVPHRCGLPATGTCRSCGQSFCGQHLTIDTQGAICASCAGDTSSDSAYSTSDLDYFDRVSEDDRGEEFTDLS